MFSKYLTAISKILGYTFAFFCLVGSLVFAYTSLAPVDVIKGWSITSEKNNYMPSEEIILNSKLIKLMATTSNPGGSRRSLVCGNQLYPINEAIANASTGTKTTQIHMYVPDKVPQLPKTCHINITVDYIVYGYRSITETVNSNNFTVVASE